MKKILFKYFMLITCIFGLSGCGYLITFGIFMLDGRCADWNCTKLNPRWEKRVDVCNSINNATVLRELGYKFSYTSTAQVQDSEIGLHISGQCSRNGGKYDIRKDKEYEHLFVK